MYIILHNERNRTLQYRAFIVAIVTAATCFGYVESHQAVIIRNVK